MYFLVVLIPLKFHQPQPNGGQLATIFPGSMVKCLLSMFQRNERVVLVSKRKRYKCSASRKIVKVKTLADGQDVYVKAMIKMSYGSMQRRTVIMFENGIPSKAHCSCPVGLSGICCHVLALLLFLKHYHETGERILALTGTEQLQKWHRCSHKSSIPMVLLRELKAKTAVHAERKGGGIQAADPQNSTMKRDV